MQAAAVWMHPSQPAYAGCRRTPMLAAASFNFEPWDPNHKFRPCAGSLQCCCALKYFIYSFLFVAWGCMGASEIRPIICWDNNGTHIQKTRDNPGDMKSLEISLGFRKLKTRRNKEKSFKKYWKGETGLLVYWHFMWSKLHQMWVTIEFYNMSNKFRWWQEWFNWWYNKIGTPSGHGCPHN